MAVYEATVGDLLWVSDVVDPAPLDGGTSCPKAEWNLDFLAHFAWIAAAFIAALFLVVPFAALFLLVPFSAGLVVTEALAEALDEPLATLGGVLLL